MYETRCIVDDCDCSRHIFSSHKQYTFTFHRQIVSAVAFVWRMMTSETENKICPSYVHGFVIGESDVESFQFQINFGLIQEPQTKSSWPFG